MRRKFLLKVMILSFLFVAMGGGHLFAQNLLVNCDYNSSTEGYGTTKFSNYASAYAYATANATNATIVIEKTNTLSGNTFDNNHKNYSKLAVVIKDGATMGNALSKWDMTYPVTVEPGGTLTCARPISASVSNIHIKNKLIVGAKDSSKKAYVDFLSDTYQDCDISIRYNGSIEVYNADFKIQDLDAQGKLTIEDSEVYVDGAFASATFFATTLTNTEMVVNGNQISGGLSDFAGGDANQLGNVKINNSTLTINEGTTKVAANVTATDSDIDVNSLTINSGKKLTLKDGSTLASESLTSNGTIELNDGSTIDAEEIVSGGTVTIDGVEATIEDNVLYYPVADFNALKAAVEAGKGVKLTADITATGAVDGTDANIDLNEKTLKLSVGGNNFFGDSKVKNGSINITGCVASGDCIIGIGDYSNSATLTFDNVNVTGDGYSSAYAVLYVYNSSELNINGGSVVVSNDNASAGGVIKAHKAADGKINIVGTEGNPVELTFNNAKIGMLDGTVLMNYVDLDITGGANAINQSALTIKNSTLDITGADGRALTLSQGNVVVENSTLNFSDCSEGEIRFKKSLELTTDNTSTINECTTYADASATDAKINGVDVDASESSMAVVTVENGTTTVKEAPQGNDFTGYTSTDNAIWGETWGNAYESFVIKVLDANGNVMGTTSLNNIDGIIDGDVNVTWSLKLNAASNTDGYWDMSWTTAPYINNMPAKVELWVDDVKVSGGNVVLNGPDEINKIYAAVTDNDGKIYSYHTSIANAVDAITGTRSAEQPNVIALLRHTDETVTLPAGITLNLNGFTAANVSVPVAQIGETPYYTLAEAVAAAQDKDVIEIIKEGNYTLPEFAGKELTFKGSSTGTSITDWVNKGSQGMMGSTVHFENLTISGQTGNYYGLFHTNAVTYKDCNINGLRFLYSPTTFTNCAFNANGVEHSFWTYGASNVTVTGCTFTYTDRAVNCYSENGANHELDITFEGCSFTYAGTKDAPEGAVEINSSSVKSIDLVMDGCTAPEKGAMWFNSQWDPKHGANTVVEVDGVLVWTAPVKIGETKYGSLQAAINAAVDGDVVTLHADNAENVTVTQKPDVKFTIDGADKTMTGTITIDGKSAAYPTAGITVKNMNFTAATEAVCINLGVKGNNNTRYTNNVTVESCHFTGTDKTAVGIKSYTGGDKNLIVKDCNATGMHSLMQLKNTAGVSVTECEITDSKNGISLGASSGVAINETTVDCDGYGVRADANDNGNATITDCTIEAFIPVVVRNASKDYALQFNGENTMTATNEDGLWCAIGTTEYEKNGTMPTAPTGDVTVTLNDTGLSMDGVYGEHFALNGEGTAESPYLINNLYELKGFRDQVNAGNNYAGKYVKLAANINLNNEEWTPIGDNTTIGNNTNQFKGYFDGNEKTISNLKISGSNRYVGLFGYIKGQGMSATTTPSVKDLTLENVNVSGDYYVGGLAGQAFTCNITNVTVKGEVSGVRYVGGLVGHVYTYFKDCRFIGNASCSFDALGGIAGAGDCRAYDCSVIGDITGSNWVGGIVGNGQEGTSAVGCYVNGDVKTSEGYYRGVGGIAGVAGHGYPSSEFKNNYFDGEVYLEGEKVPAMIMGIVNAENNESIGTTVEGNSWNTDNYDVNTPVYVVAEISSSNASLEEWIAGTSEELTKPRNNNLVMLESDIQYVDATDIDDVTIMKFSEVTEDDILPQIEENKQVAYIDSNADGAYTEGETKYTSLADAYTAATDGQTITLLKNITLGEKFDITKSITLDGNGKTLTYTGTDRAIDVPNDANANLDVTIKNLTVVATTANRGLNYNENGNFNVEGVTVTIGENVDGYAINFPGMADNAQVTIKNSKLTSRNPLNIWGEDMVINVYDSEIISVENSSTYDYAAIQLNNDNYGNVANGTIVNVYGGKITALNDEGEPSNVVANATETGVVNISDETVITGKVLNYVANIGGVYFGSLQAAVNAIEKYGYNSPIVIMKSFATSETATVKNGLNVTIDLNGKTITGTDKGTASFGLITNKGNLTITDSSEEAAGKITLEAEQNRGWNAYSSVISNTVGGKLTIIAGTLEHLGGTDMAYGIDNLTNGKGTYAETVINGGTIKSPYRAIRQFLNGIEAQNILTVNGGTIEGTNKSIWMQDPSAKANTGTLTVGENAQLKGNVYLSVTEGSTEWPVEVSIDAEALKDGAQVLTANVPAGYELQQDADGNYVVNQGVAKIGDVLYATVTEAINAAENGGTVQLLALTIDEYVAPWATDTQHTSEKSITIIGAENFGTTMTGGLYLGYDDSQCREHTIVVKGINFTGKGLKVACQQNVTIEGNTFRNITEGQAIAVVGKNIKSVVKNNVIDGVTTSNPGIELRNTLTATVEGNTISNTGHNALQITSEEGATESAIAVTNNKMSNWGTAQNAQGELEGRAMRISKIVTADVNNNVMINVNAPEEFVKITGHTTAEIDENYWNGANPTSSNTPAYFLAEGVQVHNYYAAYDAESNTLSDLVTIEGAGETLEIFYTAAGEVTEQANAAYSLMFTVTDYASKEVSVKIGSKNPAENKGCDLLIPSSVKFNDQDFAVTSIPVDGFKECKGFDKLVVPGTITSVSNSAFYNCSRLTEVVIEEGVQKLGSNTFYKISDLQTLTLPSTLTRIESLCFNGTHYIGTIVCNAQTPPTAFTGCFTESVYKNALLYVDGKYEDYKAANGWSNFKNILAVGATQTIDKDRYTLIATITDVWNRTCSVQIGTAPTNTKRAELAIPEHVSFSGIEFDITSIPEGGFQDCKYFEGTLTIPAYITSIGKNAFEGCSGVTALVVEEGVTSLGTSDTFNGCRNIETITLPSTLTKIPTRCFHNILQKLQVVECHALVPPTLASQFTNEAYNSATLYVHDVDAYKGANKWKLFKSIRLIGAVAQNKETEVEYKSIAEAVAAANAGETVQMLQNVDLENTITVAAGKEVVLDLNGYTVSYTTSEHVGEAMITNNGNLTINDSANGGKLSYAYEGGADSSYGFGNSTIENKGVLTINAGTVENTSAAMSHASYAINTGAGATLNVEGGNILNLNGHAVRMVSFDTELNTVNINGGYIEGTRALQVQLPSSASSTTKPAMDLNITGGELKSNEETYNLAIYVYSNGQSAENVSVEISGGTFNGNVAVNAAATNSMPANAVAITGGTFNGDYGVFSYSEEDAAQAVISITGGTFATNYSEWYAADEQYVFEYNEENGTYSVVEQTIFTQTTQLNAGWNWFSAYVDIDLKELQDALGENATIIKNHTTSKWTKYEEGEWYGTLETISPKEMYIINTSNTIELTLVGELVELTPITITNNWNAIGYMLNEPMSVESALNSIVPVHGDYIKSRDQYAAYDEIDGWYGTLETLIPGEGYMLKSNYSEDRLLTYSYPTRNSNSEVKDNITTDGNYWTPNHSQYPNNMTMTAMVEVEGGDYEVAAFVDGEVRGSARPIYVEALDSYMLFLTIHGEGVEEMTFKFYDLTTGEEYALNDRINYSNDAIIGSLTEPYIFNRGTTGIGEASLSDINIYPNPTTTGTEINLQATCDTVEVFNALGVKVAEYHNVDSIDAIETAGIYVIRITDNGDVKHCRLIVK